MKKLSALLAAVMLLAVAGCSTTRPSEDDGVVRVVASTNVYADLAEIVGGDRVQVTAIIDSIAQDPHSFEAGARDRLAVQKADLVIENGGGYDSFMAKLLEGSTARVITAAAFATDSDNEHVWFDPGTVIHIVDRLAEDLTALDPDGADAYAQNAQALTADVEAVQAEITELRQTAQGASVLMTEPLPGYLVAAAGLHDVTPAGFASAVEEGSDVPPAILLDAVKLLESDGVDAVLVNAQTGGSETARMEEVAKEEGIPVVAFSEILPDDQSYAEWMHDAIQSLAVALQR